MRRVLADQLEGIEDGQVCAFFTFSPVHLSQFVCPFSLFLSAKVRTFSSRVILGMSLVYVWSSFFLFNLVITPCRQACRALGHARSAAA